LLTVQQLLVSEVSASGDVAAADAGHRFRRVAAKARSGARVQHDMSGPDGMLRPLVAHGAPLAVSRLPHLLQVTTGR
jgi:hypothetical protein